MRAKHPAPGRFANAAMVVSVSREPQGLQPRGCSEAGTSEKWKHTQLRSGKSMAPFVYETYVYLWKMSTYIHIYDVNEHVYR